MSSEVHSALLAALKLLRRQDLTIAEVATRLEGKFEPDVIQNAVEFLEKHRILDLSLIHI